MKLAPDLRAALDTGDLILFSGEGIVSRLIQFGSGSEWSHVGMVLRAVEEDMVLLLESTTLSDLKDITTGRATRGVQLVSLSDRVSTYQGEIAVRRVTGARSERERLAVRQLRRAFAGRAYESGRVELLLAALPGDWAEEEILSTLFCSETVAEFWQALGWLRNDRPSNTYSPANFAGSGGDAIDANLIIEPSRLGPLLRIS